MLSAVFYFLSWKLYKPLPNSKKLLAEDGDGEDGRNSVTMSNITEGTIVEDIDSLIHKQSLFSAAQERALAKPFFVYESSI